MAVADRLRRRRRAERPEIQARLVPQAPGGRRSRPGRAPPGNVLNNRRARRDRRSIANGRTAECASAAARTETACRRDRGDPDGQARGHLPRPSNQADRFPHARLCRGDTDGSQPTRITVGGSLRPGGRPLRSLDDRRRAIDRGWSGRAASSHGLALGVAAATLIMMIWGLGRPALWLDESASVIATQRSWAGLWVLLGGTDAPLVPYYALLKAASSAVTSIAPDSAASPEVALPLAVGGSDRAGRLGVDIVAGKALPARAGDQHSSPAAGDGLVLPVRAGSPTVRLRAGGGRGAPPSCGRG